MTQSTEGLFTGLNALYLEELTRQYLEDPSQLDASWQAFFEGEGRELLNGGVPPNEPSFSARSIFAGPVTDASGATAEGCDAESLTAQMHVMQLINSYRRYGHLKADLDPLGLWKRDAHDHLSPEHWSLGPEHRERRFSTASLYGPKSMTLTELIAFLEETYARTIGAEFTHLTNEREVEWLTERCERNRNHCDLDEETQRFILEQLCAAEAFEKFLHVKFLGAKRFSLQGAESLIPLLAFTVETSAQLGVKEVVLGMPHRGRLNVLSNIYKKDPIKIFSEFADVSPEEFIGRGDVKYHMGHSSDVTTRHGDDVHLSMAFNPSHLEAINPVITGRVRAKQDRIGEGGTSQVLPVLLHGDAAFPGQGLVAETLNLMNLEGYSVGGTIHIIVNNQIGFTTLPQSSRSSTYSTDIAKMIEVPIFHVNGEDPEAVAQVVRIATEYRQTFHKDFIIDMYGFRRYGHNETDEPHFTQPKMYQTIDRHPAVHEVYAKRLNLDAFADTVFKNERKRLNAALKDMRNGGEPKSNGERPMQGLWQDYKGGPDSDTPCDDTTITPERFKEVLVGLTTTPDDFTPHNKITNILDMRHQMIEANAPIDWGAGESLAFGSLLLDGHPIRISGQDCQRGTFSHRHAVIHDQTTGGVLCPLQHLAPGQPAFNVHNSPLSEAAVLGFDLGYAMDTPEALVIWEAQFGDFANGAQVIIDQFLSSCEDKWERLSGVTLLLPHGYEGQGPEHSSARLERYLQLCAEDNMQVCNLTTPSQIFHVLRRQVVRKWRKPLIVMTPKSLLRHRRATSTIEDFTERGFLRVIPELILDEGADIRRAVICSGKVYYELLEHREQTGANDTAIIRLEQLYPFPTQQLEAAILALGDLDEVVWCQEEPENMGGYYFLFPRLVKLFAGGPSLRWVTRAASASPATGSKRAHHIEQTQLLEAVFRTP